MMFSGFPRLPPMAEPHHSFPLERRLRAEWEILGQLAARNPGRLSALAMDDTVFRLTLHATPALSLNGTVQDAWSEPMAESWPPGCSLSCHLVREHQIRLEFPLFFPAVPLELYLETPVRHPNIHPGTGFVCLWDRHRVSNTVEHALHKTVAILGWRLYNADPVHVMQPYALHCARADGERIRERLAAPALHGSLPQPASLPPADREPDRRRRLS